MNRRLFLLIIALGLLAVLGAAWPQERSVTYRRYDVDITVYPDGTFRVDEVYHLTFEGEFHSGFAEIPLTHVTDIRDVQVREEGTIPYSFGSGGPGSFDVERDESTLYVDWEFITPTVGIEERTFIVSYRVIGGLSVYPDGTWLSWRAVPAARSGITVENSRVTVRLPQPVATADLQLDTSPTAAIHWPDGQTIVFETQEPLPSGQAFVVTVGMPPGLVNASAPEWQRELDEADLEYRLEALDVDLTIADDGRLTVDESQRVAVDQGVLYHGYREISLYQCDRIGNVSVRSDGQIFLHSGVPCDYCYVVEQRPVGDWVRPQGNRVLIDKEQAGSVLVEWAFPAVVEGQVITFDLSYDVLGAVRVLTDRQEIAWTVVFADRDVPVERARLRVHLPPSLAPDAVAVVDEQAVLLPDGTLEIAHDGPVPPGEEWVVTLRLPPDALAAVKPDWQRRLEAVLAEREAYLRMRRQMETIRARWQLTFGVIGVLLPVLGLLGVLLAWYFWGRDYPLAPKTYLVREPPSDLPPGIVAYLVDERPTVKGVLGDLFRLATLGLISIDLQQHDFTITLNQQTAVEAGTQIQVDDGPPVTLAAHEATLFATLLKAARPDRPLRFSDVRSAFVAALPTIYEQMGEMASRYFASSLPDEIRRGWNWAGQRVVIAAVMLAVALTCFLSSLGPVVYAPPAGLALVGLMLMVVSRWMPQRTRLGAVEAARWRAFRRYLAGLKRYGDLKAAQEALDRYFPYAIALGVKEIVLKQAGESGARMPSWTRPAQIRVLAEEREGEERSVVQVLRPRPTAEPAADGAVARHGKALRLPQQEMPDLSLQSISDSLARSLDRASESLSDLLNAAIGDQEESPFEVALSTAGGVVQGTWDITSEIGSTTLDVLESILKAASSGGGGGGYSGSDRRRRYRSSSWSSSSSRSSSRSWTPSHRSSSFTSRSGGGGRRGFR